MHLVSVGCRSSHPVSAGLLPGCTARTLSVSPGSHRLQHDLIVFVDLDHPDIAPALPSIVCTHARLHACARSYGCQLRELFRRVRPYHAEYGASERQALEARLKSGDLCCLITTSALELGVDIGDLSATVHVGINPVKASLMQQAGRAGEPKRPKKPPATQSHDLEANSTLLCCLRAHDRSARCGRTGGDTCLGVDYT